MTRIDDMGAVWVLGQLWGAPPDVAGELNDDENLAYGMSLLHAANGDGEITDAERDWILGYLAAAGCSQGTLDALRAYDDSADFEDLFTAGFRQISQRVTICDAIRACGADGDLSEGELATVHAMARRIGVSADVVDEFVDIYEQEQALKARRIALAFPAGFAVS